MKKEILTNIFATIFTMLISFFVTWVASNSANITYSSIKMEDNNYYTTILMKNFKQSEYLKDIDILVDDEITIKQIYLNGLGFDVDDNKIMISSFEPLEIKNITIITDKQLTTSNTKLVKNDQNISIDNYNSKQKIGISVVIILLSYALINFIISMYIDSKSKKRIDEKIVEVKKNEEECKKNKKSLEKLEKDLTTYKTVFSKEMNDLEKENEFYQKLLLKKCDNTITKEQLEKMISKELKTFNKKKYKHLNYEDVYDIVTQLANTKNDN